MFTYLSIAGVSTRGSDHGKALPDHGIIMGSSWDHGKALPDHSVHRCGASLVSVLRAEVAVREEVHDCVESLRRQELVYSSLERVG